MARIELGWKAFEHHFVRGTAVGVDKKLETKVQGGGGGGSSYRGTGYTAPVRVTSTTTTHDLIHLQDENGQEHAIRLQNWDLAVRETHDLTAMWLAKPGKSGGPYVAIHNHSLEQTDYDEKGIAKLARPLLILLAAWVIIVLLPFSGGVTFVLCVGAFVAWWIYGIVQAKKLIASGQLLRLAGI